MQQTASFFWLQGELSCVCCKRRGCGVRMVFPQDGVSSRWCVS